MTEGSPDAHGLAATLAALPNDADWAGWPAPAFLTSVDSTMTWVRAKAAEGAPEGTAVIADEQTAGRGRHGRGWTSPPGCGVWSTILVRPDPLAAARLSVLPLLIGVEIADSLCAFGGDGIAVKWPNDIVVTEGPDEAVRKIAGVLAERLADGSVIIGVGLNVSTPREFLPESASTLADHLGRSVPRPEAASAVLRGVSRAYRRWTRGEHDLERYRGRCVTLGRHVEVAGIDGAGDVTQGWSGTALDVDDDGLLRVAVDGDDPTAARIVAVSAGDVTLSAAPS
jgi:BirA family transcriptional regulator, biotin operon repressor / biotin---[acetyl-CoA-carboxylase] ligase